MKMLPTNVYSFMKKMVSNTEMSTNVNQYVNQTTTTTTTPPGAMGRLRQTLQQAQETMSNRLTASSRPPQVNVSQPLQQPETTTATLDAQRNVQTPTSESKEEITEMPRPGSAGRCRVCVKAMKPDEYSRECTECGLRVCDDCASYSQTADGNEISWRCSVCRRRGVAIIARRVQPGIEQSEALEGVGFETTVRRSPDARRLAAGGRADSETEVLLLAPKASDVRRHSDVPLRDIAKFQAQTISAATSQHDIGNSLGVNSGSEKAKARSSNELMKKETDSSNTVPTITKDQLLSTKPGHGGDGSKSGDKVSNSRTKQGQVKRQRSYERGASEGTLNLPGNNRGRRASCDLRSIDPNALNLNNNSIPSPLTSTPTTLTSGGQETRHGGQEPRHGGNGRHSAPPEKHNHDGRHGGEKQHSKPHGGSGGGGGGVSNSSMSGGSGGRGSISSDSSGSGQERGGVKNVTSGNTEPSNLIIKNDMRRRSVQITNTSSKPSTAPPRSCTSLDASDNPPEQKKPFEPPVIKRQGSSADGEAIKIVIDDVDSNTAKDNNKGQGSSLTEGSELRTRVVRLRRDPQDRGYQTRGFGIRVVGGCSSSQGSPGHLRARVARVTSGSGADFAGIRRGDVVLSWNGIRLTNLTFEDTCKVMDASGDSVELTIASYDSDALISSAVPENEATTSNDWEETGATSAEGDSLGLNTGDRGDTSGCPSSPTNRRRLPRLPGEGRIQLRLFNDEIHNTLEIAVVNIAFGQEDSSTLDLNDIIITLRIGEKIATTRWNQCTLFTKVSPEDLFDSWLIMELQRGSDFLGECHVDMGRVSLDDRPVWFPFSSKGTSSHRGSISQIMSSAPGTTTPSARELARRLRMRGLAAGSQSQSEEQDDSSGQSSPCASSLLRPEVAWEVLGTLGPPGVVLTCRSAPTSRRGSAQSDRVAIGVDDGQNERGSLPSTPQMPRSLPPSRRGSFAVAVEEIINRSRRSSVAYQQRVPDTLGRQLPEIPDGFDPSMMRNRRNSAWNPREVVFDRRTQFERTDSLRAITPVNPPRRVSADFRDFRGDPRNQARKSGDPDESWRQQPQPQQQWSQRD